MKTNHTLLLLRVLLQTTIEEKEKFKVNKSPNPVQVLLRPHGTIITTCESCIITTIINDTTPTTGEEEEQVHATKISNRVRLWIPEGRRTLSEAHVVAQL